jgi:hypothetical protein
MTLQGRRGGTENGVVSFGLDRKGRQTVDLIDLKVGCVLWCLTSLSAIFLLYCDSVLLVEETTERPQAADKLHHIMLYTSPERDSNSQR